MSAVLEVANYDDTDFHVTAMPLFETWSSDNYFSRADRTGEEMLREPQPAEYRRGRVTYPMWNFRVSGVPLAVTVSFDDGVWIAAIDSFDVFGDGESPRDALDELEVHIRNYMQFYRSQRPANLTEFARRRREQFLKIRVRG